MCLLIKIGLMKYIIHVHGLRISFTQVIKYWKCQKSLVHVYINVRILTIMFNHVIGELTNLFIYKYTRTMNQNPSDI